ncbi:MAG: hypothetical protein Tsb0034_04940 [Ekhidna sp.]
MEKAAKNGFWAYGQLISDKEFDPIRDRSEFEDILKIVEKNAFPCLTDEKNKQFDFWLGEWDVYVNANKVGENSITKAQGGCAVHEFYSTVPGGFAGQSINYYDPIDKKWRQNWVGNSGRNVSKYIEIDSSEGMLQFLDDDNRTANGQKMMVRMTFTYLPKYDAVRQFIESSTDDGKTWTPAFDGLYVRKDTPYPSGYNK